MAVLIITMIKQFLITKQRKNDMFIVSYIIYDASNKYFPVIKFLNTRDEAEKEEAQIEERIKHQAENTGQLFEGKVISEPYLFEVDFKIYVDEG